MPAPKRIVRMTYVLVPETHADRDGSNITSVRAAQSACRVAFQLGFMPVSPLLYFMTFLSEGELSMEIRKLAQQWLRRCDRIWLQFPDGEDSDVLDSLSFSILDTNQRMSERRPVYLLHSTGDEKIGYIPVAMARQDIHELLNVNLTAGLMRHCI